MLIAVNYHYIRHKFKESFPSIYGVTPQHFEDQLKTLASIGSFLSQDAIISSISSKTLHSSSNQIAITFDDGLKEQYDLALPILNKLGIPAVFFVNSKVLVEEKVLNVHKIHIVRSKIDPAKILDFIYHHFRYVQDEIQIMERGIQHYKYDIPEVAYLKYVMNFIMKSDQVEEIMNYLFVDVLNLNEAEVHGKLYMNKNQIKHLAELGYLGSHGHAHIPLGKSTLSIQEDDVSLSKKILERISDSEIRSFSYPYGSKETYFGVDECLSRNNFLFAFTMEREINFNLDSPLLLSRFDNNDMPLGKAYRFRDNNIFQNYPLRQIKVL